MDGTDETSDEFNPSALEKAVFRFIRIISGIKSNGKFGCGFAA